MFDISEIAIWLNLSFSPPVVVSDGDGSQDHLLPVCMDDACTKSAIYLAKPGGTEVQNTPSVHHVQSFFIFPVHFFFF